MWWVFAIGWLRLGEAARAAKFFHRVTERFAFGPFQIWSEIPGGGGCTNFNTGVGAYLQIFWAGYGGLHLTDEALLIREPKVPPGATGLRFRALAYRGNLIDIRITAQKVFFRLHEESPKDAAPLVAVHSSSGGREVPLRIGVEATFLSKGSVELRVKDR